MYPAYKLLTFEGKRTSLKSFLAVVSQDVQRSGGVVPDLQELFDAGLNAYFSNGLRLSGVVEMDRNLEFLEDVLKPGVMPNQQTG